MPAAVAPTLAPNAQKILTVVVTIAVGAPVAVIAVFLDSSKRRADAIRLLHCFRCSAVFRRGRHERRGLTIETRHNCEDGGSDHQESASRVLSDHHGPRAASSPSIPHATAASGSEP